MSKARDEYRKFIVDHAWEWEDEPVLNYVTELEAEKAELIAMLESISNIAMGKIKFDIDQLLSKYKEGETHDSTK